VRCNFRRLGISTIYLLPVYTVSPFCICPFGSLYNLTQNSLGFTTIYFRDESPICILSPKIILVLTTSPSTSAETWKAYLQIESQIYPFWQSQIHHLRKVLLLIAVVKFSFYLIPFYKSIVYIYGEKVYNTISNNLNFVNITIGKFFFFWYFGKKDWSRDLGLEGETLIRKWK